MYRTPDIVKRPATAFRESEAEYFNGRSKEIREILSSLYANKYVWLHGAAGAGKTSLLAGGVFPRVRKKVSHILHVKIPVGWEAPSIQGVRLSDPPNLSDDDVLIDKLAYHGLRSKKDKRSVLSFLENNPSEALNLYHQLFKDRFNEFKELLKYLGFQIENENECESRDNNEQMLRSLVVFDSVENCLIESTGLGNKENDSEMNQPMIKHFGRLVMDFEQGMDQIAGFFFPYERQATSTYYIFVTRSRSMGWFLKYRDFLPGRIQISVSLSTLEQKTGSIALSSMLRKICSDQPEPDKWSKDCGQFLQKTISHNSGRDYKNDDMLESEKIPPILIRMAVTYLYYEALDKANQSSSISGDCLVSYANIKSSFNEVESNMLRCYIRDSIRNVAGSPFGDTSSEVDDEMVWGIRIILAGGLISTRSNGDNNKRYNISLRSSTFDSIEKMVGRNVDVNKLLQGLYGLENLGVVEITGEQSKDKRLAGENICRLAHLNLAHPLLDDNYKIVTKPGGLGRKWEYLTQIGRFSRGEEIDYVALPDSWKQHSLDVELQYCLTCEAKFFQHLKDRVVLEDMECKLNLEQNKLEESSKRLVQVEQTITDVSKSLESKEIRAGRLTWFIACLIPFSILIGILIWSFAKESVAEQKFKAEEQTKIAEEQTKIAVEQTSKAEKEALKFKAAQTKLNGKVAELDEVNKKLKLSAVKLKVRSKNSEKILAIIAGRTSDYSGLLTLKDSIKPEGKQSELSLADQVIDLKMLQYRGVKRIKEKASENTNRDKSRSFTQFLNDADLTDVLTDVLEVFNGFEDSINLRGATIVDHRTIKRNEMVVEVVVLFQITFERRIDGASDGKQRCVYFPVLVSKSVSVEGAHSQKQKVVGVSEIKNLIKGSNETGRYESEGIIIIKDSFQKNVSLVSDEREGHFGILDINDSETIVRVCASEDQGAQRIIKKEQYELKFPLWLPVQGVLIKPSAEVESKKSLLLAVTTGKGIYQEWQLSASGNIRTGKELKKIEFGALSTMRYYDEQNELIVEDKNGRHKISPFVTESRSAKTNKFALKKLRLNDDYEFPKEFFNRTSKISKDGRWLVCPVMLKTKVTTVTHGIAYWDLRNIDFTDDEYLLGKVAILGTSSEGFIGPIRSVDVRSGDGKKTPEILIGFKNELLLVSHILTENGEGELLARKIILKENYKSISARVIRWIDIERGYKFAVGSPDGSYAIFSSSESSLEKTEEWEVMEANLGEKIKDKFHEILEYSDGGNHFILFCSVAGRMAGWDLSLEEEGHFDFEGLTEGELESAEILSKPTSNENTLNEVDLVVGDVGGNIKKYKVDIKDKKITLDVGLYRYEKSAAVHRIISSPDGEFLISGTKSGGVRLWKRSFFDTGIEANFPLHIPNLNSDPIRSLNIVSRMQGDLDVLRLNILMKPQKSKDRLNLFTQEFGVKVVSEEQ